VTHLKHIPLFTTENRWLTAFSTGQFDAASWPTGNAPFGFGHATEATTLACGPNAPNCDERHARYLFRQEFMADRLEGITSVLAQVRRDDGIVVYLNGEEVFRESNSRGSSFASSTSLDDGYAAFRIDPRLLQAHNTLAVEVRQARSRVDTDLNFDLTLVAERVPEPASASVLSWLIVASWLSASRRRRGA
jgi:hypothetical protein